MGLLSYLEYSEACAGCPLERVGLGRGVINISHKRRIHKQINTQAHTNSLCDPQELPGSDH